MKKALDLIFLYVTALSQITDASPPPSNVPFVLTLTLRVPEPSVISERSVRDAAPDDQVGRGSTGILGKAAVQQRSGKDQDTTAAMLEVVKSLNETFQSLKELVDVRMVSRTVKSRPESGMVVEEVVLEGAVVSRCGRSIKSVNLSPSSLSVFFLELAGSFVGLAWGTYSQWMAG